MTWAVRLKASILEPACAAASAVSLAWAAASAVSLASAAASAVSLAWAATCVAQNAVSTNVPDAITRQSGLRLEPMPRAAQLYAANCQGCHGHRGVSVSEIPTLAGRIGYFARIPEGRRYLVQVPNVAMNPSSDAEIAEMLNWVLRTYSRAQLPADFQPYTAEEVAGLRPERIDVPATRRSVIERLVASKQVPAADVLAIPQSTLY